MPFQAPRRHRPYREILFEILFGALTWMVVSAAITGAILVILLAGATA